MSPNRPVRKLSVTQQNDLLSFLQSNNVPVVGNYSLGKTIGEGSFGKVKIGTHKMTGQQVAIKICEKIHAPQLVREIETWRQLRHPSIAQLYEVLCTETKIYMVMEYCKGGEVFEYIERNGRLDDSDDKCKRIFRQIVEAVGYCHEKNFVHRDLKLENILLTHHGNVKLIDFGFTRDYEDTKLLDTYCGSSAYAAPEIVGAKKYSGREADIWSLGVIMFTLVAGYLPFDDDNDAMIHKKIMQLDFELPDFLCEDTRDLIMRFLRIEPSNRITIPEALAHPWFNLLATSTTKVEEHVIVSSASADLLKTALLTGSREEYLVAAKLEALGFDVQSILSSVQTNSCDQNAALWYLLLQRQRELGIQASMSSNLASASNTPYMSRSPSASQPAELEQKGSTFNSEEGMVDPSRLSTASHSTTFQMTVNVERYFQEASRRSSQAENPIMTMATSSMVTSSDNLSGPGSSSVSSPPLIMSPNSPNLPMSNSGSGISNLAGSPGSTARGGRRGIMMDTMRSTSDAGRRTKNVVGRYGIGGNQASVNRRPKSAGPGELSDQIRRGPANISEEPETDDVA